MHRFFAASMSRGLLAVWSLTLAMITQGGAQATPMFNLVRPGDPTAQHARPHRHAACPRRR